jgi:hypothetical protein
MSDEIRKEQHKVPGSKLLEKVKELVHKGNVRRITIKDHEENVLVEIPLTVGVVGALLAPHAAVIGAIAALVTQSTIEVEKVVEKKDVREPALAGKLN